MAAPRPTLFPQEQGVPLTSMVCSTVGRLLCQTPWVLHQQWVGPGTAKLTTYYVVLVACGLLAAIAAFSCCSSMLRQVLLQW
jgi:hypothetical protein